MPWCVVCRDKIYLMVDGVQQKFERGELVRLAPRDPLIVAEDVEPLSDADLEECVTCVCGRRFYGTSVAHFAFDGHKPAGSQAALEQDEEQAEEIELEQEEEQAEQVALEQKEQVVEGEAQAEASEETDAMPKRRGRKKVAA